LFDESFYLANNPDILKSNDDPVLHYLIHGGFEGRNPSENFNSAFYLEKYPDVKEIGKNPLAHFILFGKSEGRRAIPNEVKNCDSYYKNNSEKDEFVNNNDINTDRYINLQDVELLKDSEYFDVVYYMQEDPEMKMTGIDPVEHYLTDGWKEGRNPSVYFNTNFYLNKYSDVYQANMNPLLHFINFGESENRLCTEKGNNYNVWINKYDTLSTADIEEMNHEISCFKIKPLISVLMPVYNPNPVWLIEALNSVVNQIYPYWELCIADDCSSNNEIKQILDNYVQNDSRIKVVYRIENGHISAASNSALELVTGEFVALLDHDDLLSIHALFWVAKTIVNIPHVKLIYSDEDKIDINGIRQNPHFKSDWNPELFYSQNMVSHLGIYDTALMRKIGGFRIGFEGSQDYDLALRFIEIINSNKIYHIPKVLYHWRLNDNSTSVSMDFKGYAIISAIKALNDSFNRTQTQANVDIIHPGMYRVHYKLPDPIPHVTIIIPTKNNTNLLKTCIQSILNKTTYSAYDILVIDNESNEKEFLQFMDQLKPDKRISFISDDRTFNYSALNNIAISVAKGEFVCLLNNDTEIINASWLGEMVAVAVQTDIGAVGAKLYYPNGKIQHAGVILGSDGTAILAHQYCRSDSLGYFGRATLMQEMSAVSGNCLLVSKKKYFEVGGLDEVNLTVAYNDVDFCLKLKKAGYRNIWTPFAELYHHESASRNNDIAVTKSQIFINEKAFIQEQWGTALQLDPAYNPNLTLSSGYFSLSFPPRLSNLQIDFSKNKSV
jgi:GT2 family glycosyltransferase